MVVLVVGRIGFGPVWSSVRVRRWLRACAPGPGRVCAWVRLGARVCACVRLTVRVCACASACFDNLSTTMTLCQSMGLSPARLCAGTRLGVCRGVRERVRGCARGPPDAAGIPLLRGAGVVIRGTRST